MLHSWMASKDRHLHFCRLDCHLCLIAVFVKGLWNLTPSFWFARVVIHANTAAEGTLLAILVPITWNSTVIVSSIIVNLTTFSVVISIIRNHGAIVVTRARSCTHQ